MRSAELFIFIKERYNIWKQRQDDLPPPWTTDKILQTYRFCNVYREHDKVSRWISDNWLMPNISNLDLWFAMVVARLFNNPSTLKHIGFPVPFNALHMKDMIEYHKNFDKKVFNPAYIVSTNGVAMDKVDYLISRVMTPLWIDRSAIRPVSGDSLAVFAKRLMRYDGFAGFMAGQVVADMKYVVPLLNAPDWMTFAVSGPGSRRGMNRVYGHELESGWFEKTWHSRLMDLQKEIHLLQRGTGMQPLHAQDLQNCLCEFDKYERVRLGEGRPKQLYKGAK